MSQLIILGNGFDLHCGLKSSYKDFFEQSIIDNTGAAFHLQQMKSAPKQPLGFWEELLFMYYMKYGSVDYKWCDIETIIKKTLWLINFGESNVTSPNPTEGLWADALPCHEGNNYFGYEAEQIKDTIKVYLINYCAYFFYNNLPSSEKSDDEKRHLLNTYLLQELKNFERRFCKYIKDKIVNHTNEKKLNNKYIVNAVNLISYLTGFSDNNFESIEDVIEQKQIQEMIPTGLNMRTSSCREINVLSDEFAKLKDVHLLSFNYTALFDILAVESPCLYSNVHGKLCLEKCESCTLSSVIFGIDDTVIQSQNANDELRIFSKTYRKMSDTGAPKSILPPNNGKPLTIKFYGHSLSEADYSYFQSIFDFYNLYENNKVNLIFYYSNPFEQTDAIYRLINTYGKTFVNQQQGKNLMHKLLLENRVKIVEISLNT